MRVHVCAEAGLNHSGSLAVAVDLMRVAKEAGCDSVKFQKRTLPDAVPPSMRDVERDTPWGRMPYAAYKERIEFSHDDLSTIAARAWEIGVPWSASSFDAASVPVLEHHGVPWHKVPSACITDMDLLRAVVDTGKPVILSTGGASWAEIDRAVEIVQHARRLTLLHCCSLYPHPAAHARLLVLDELRQRYGFPVGFSSHGIPDQHEAVLGAVARGAAMVEVHITLSRHMWGSDQKASLEPGELVALVRSIRRMSEAVSHGGERPVSEEERAKIMTMRRENFG